MICRVAIVYSTILIRHCPGHTSQVLDRAVDHQSSGAPQSVVSVTPSQSGQAPATFTINKTLPVPPGRYSHAATPIDTLLHGPHELIAASLGLILAPAAMK